MKKNILITLIIFVIVGMLMVACQPAANDTQQPAAEQDQQEQQTEATSMPSDASSEVVFDPAMGGNTEAAGLVYESLLKAEGDGLLPVLAVESTVSDDGLDYIINLRPGVIFHDGSAFNADVVIANFDRWSDKANGVEAWASSFGGYKGEVDKDGKLKSIYDGIEKVDELTVLVHLNTPDAEFLNKLADPALAIASAQTLASANFGSENGGDGGSGPYMIKTWSADALKLEPYAGYWNPDAIPSSGMDIAIGK